MSKRATYEARFKPFNKGKNGGLGSVRSFIFTGKPGDASKKLRNRGVIIKVIKAR